VPVWSFESEKLEKLKLEIVSQKRKKESEKETRSVLDSFSIAG
jgi:hypothetical protein